MDKYSKLGQRFDGQNESKIVLTFEEIKSIAGIDINHSFLNYKKNLELFGYRVDKISLKNKLVTFEKIQNREIVLVDENDKEIGTGEKMDVHEKGLLHRSISVLIFNSKGEMLLQQRAFGKYHCGGMRSNTTCTHPLHGEKNIDAAHRRLKEEMGFDCELKEIFEFHYAAHFDNGLTENEYDHVFKGIYDGAVNINPDEVNDYKWIKIEDLKKDISLNLDSYTHWFKIILEKYLSM